MRTRAGCATALSCLTGLRLGADSKNFAARGIFSELHRGALVSGSILVSVSSDPATHLALALSWWSIQR